MARTNSSTLSGTVLAQAQQTTSEALVLEPNADGIVVVPRGVLTPPIVYVKRGDDLLLEGEDAASVAVRGYFLTDPPPVLLMPDGAEIDPTLLRAFLPPEGADAATETVVARVSDVTGEVFVIRPGQPPVRLNPGDPVYATDTIQTSDGAHLSLLFADGTSRSIDGRESIALQDFGFAVTGATPSFGAMDVSPASGDAAPSKATTQFTIISGEIAVTTQTGTVRMNQRGETISVSNTDGRISDTVVLSESELLGLYGDLTYTVTGTQRSDSGSIDDEAERLNEIDTAAGGEPDAGRIASSGGDSVPGLVSPFRLSLSDLLDPPPVGNEPLPIPEPVTSSPSDSGSAESAAADDDDTTAIVPEAPNAVPLAVADIVPATEDLAATILAATLLGNDADPDGDPLSLVSVANAVNGAVSLDANGDVLFTPDTNFNGLASFDYTTADGNGGFASATVTVTVAAVNDAPVASPDSAGTIGETAVTVLASTLLANDTDVEGDTLSLASVQGGVNGTAKLDADGNVQFAPDVGFLGAASFEYTVSDSNGGAASATVSVRVDRPPSLSPDQIAGLNLWLDGADPATLVDSDGDGALNRWLDKSGANHEAAAPSAGQQPGLADGATFDGTDDVLAIPDAPDLNLAESSAAKTLSLVFTTGADVATRQVLYEQGGNARGLNLFIENGQAFVGGYNLNETAWGPVFISGTVAPNTVNSLSLTFEAVAGTLSGTISGRLNGTFLGSVDGVGLLYAHTSDIGLGRMEQDSVFPDGLVTDDGLGFGGTIHEVAFFNRALNAAETIGLHTYYADKWSISPTVSDNSPADGTLTFGAGNDTIIVDSTHAAIFGGDGNDHFIAEDLGFGHLDGGGGFDTITLQGEDRQFDLRGIRDDRLSGFEAINLTGSGDNLLVLDEDTTFAVSGDTRALRIDGDPGDMVTAAGDWSPAGDTSIGGAGYSVFTSDTTGATLQIDTAVAMNIG